MGNHEGARRKEADRLGTIVCGARAVFWCARWAYVEGGDKDEGTIIGTGAKE